MTPNKIKQIRRQHDLTQKELAGRMGVNQSQISRWERGIQPVPEWVDRLLECLFKKAVKE